MKQNFKSKLTKSLFEAKIVENLSRKKFISSFIDGMIKMRSVQFCEVAEALNPAVKSSSNEIRIQDFFREVQIDYQQVAVFLLSFLPEGKITLCIDRTEWDFGKTQVNILMLLAKCGEMHIPLYWELLDNNSGNSNCEDRIALLKSCIDLLGKNRIGLVLGDREFIGHAWLKFLKNMGIPFCMRIPKSHNIERLNGEIYKAEALLKGRKVIRMVDCMVDGVWGNVYLKQLPDDILFLFATVRLDFIPQLYKNRWTIECFFQNCKGRGFDLENTHLKSLEKLKKLVAMVSLAYGFCFNLGFYYDKNIRKIPLKKHGYKAKSFFRKGMDILRDGALASIYASLIHSILDMVISNISLFNTTLSCPLKKVG